MCPKIGRILILQHTASNAPGKDSNHLANFLQTLQLKPLLHAVPSLDDDIGVAAMAAYPSFLQLNPDLFPRWAPFRILEN